MSEEQRITATLVRKIAGWNSDARLYRLNRAVHYDEGETEFVVVSAVIAPYSGPETYIFPANAAGEVTDWGEMDGSSRGDLDHEAAIRRAGWEVA